MLINLLNFIGDLNMNKRVIYLSTTRLQSIAKIPNEYRIEIWTPSLLRLIPPGKPLKYSILSLASIFKLLPNNNFLQIKIFDKAILVSSLMVVPKTHKFPYMNKKDIQFIYV